MSLRSSGVTYLVHYQRECPGVETSRRCAFAEPELLSYRKPKRVVHNKKNGNTHPGTSAIDYGGVQLTKAQCHVVPISIL